MRPKNKGLVRIIMDRDDKMGDETEEPKDGDKHTEREKKVSHGSRKDKEVKKNKSVTRTEKNHNN